MPFTLFLTLFTRTVVFLPASFQNCYHSVTTRHHGCGYCSATCRCHPSISCGHSSASTTTCSSRSRCTSGRPVDFPYEKGHLDLASRHRSSQFRNGAQALASKFTGKVNALQLFLANLKTRAKTCRWDHPTHGILTMVVAGTEYNLLDDYAKITDAQVEAARAAHNAADTSPRAKQISQMMYECLMASIPEEAKLALVSRDQEFHEDGPSLFYHVVSQLFTATFSNAQVTRDNPADFHPKRFQYNVIQVNNYISSAVMTLKAASSAGGTITDQEILYFKFKVYKKIKAPAEWTTHILFLELTVASTPGYTPETLFNKMQAKYTTLLNQGLWKPSDKTPKEQTLSMVAQQQQVKKGSNNPAKSKSIATQGTKPMEKDEKNPPFANSHGKLGTGDPSIDPSNTPTTRFDVVPPPPPPPRTPIAEPPRGEPT